VPGVVGGVGDATPSTSISVAVMDVPTLVPLTSSITPGGMFAPVSRSNWVPVVTEISRLPIMKLNVAEDVPAAREAIGLAFDLIASLP